MFFVLGNNEINRYLIAGFDGYNDDNMNFL